MLPSLSAICSKGGVACRAQHTLPQGQIGAHSAIDGHVLNWFLGWKLGRVLFSIAVYENPEMINMCLSLESSVVYS